ncbi:shikimate dehydrogenase [Actinophytocola sp. NPDC049390]|uniref:shikimate dehydrogenase n=1 Tax=Actinophytocola sp. NPDC049390 TaxID=3363894 RepID=UPI0037B77DFD
MPTDDLAATRRAAVVGKPVAHSLSPVLHGAAYEALGLPWTYTRLEASEAELPALVASLDASWVGLSVTMPGKGAALAFATTATARATAVGAANTLVRGENGWFADCTDVDGVAGALRAAGFGTGTSAVVLGAGGTARAALAGLAELGVSSATVVVRDRARAGAAVACAAAVGMKLDVVAWASADFPALVGDAAVLVNTVPPDAVDPAALGGTPFLLDVIYHPWPTPLAGAVADRGGSVATGLDMLLHQAFGQVELFTGMVAPRQAMRDALYTATGGILPLPL